MEHIIQEKFGRRLIEWKYLAVLFSFLLVLMILMSLTYKWALLRYGFIVVLLVGMVIKRNSIMNVLRVVKRK